MAKFCGNCGNQLPENAYVCVNCGVIVNNYSGNDNSNDTGSIGWGILGFFIPLVGLILYLTWKNEKPKNAKVAGKGALISFIINVVIIVVVFVLLLFSFNSIDDYINDTYDDDYYYDYDDDYDFE